MDVYRKEYVIQSSDVDMFRRLRVSKLFTFMQEAAIHHTEILGAGRAKTLDRGFLWVVTMQHAEIKRLPVYDEKVVLSSWAGKTMHVMFPRYYEMTDEGGDVIAKGSAVWMLMDVESRRMIFPDDEGISVEGIVTGTEYPVPRPLKAVEGERKVSFRVPYSYADINGHLTNTKYFDLTEDLTRHAKEGKVPRLVAAEYAGEARFDEEFEVAIHEEDDLVFLSGAKEGGKKFFKVKYCY